MFKFFATGVVALSMTFGAVSVYASGSFRTYDGGKSYYHSDGSSTRTYDGGRSWYNSDGSSTRI